MSAIHPAAKHGFAADADRYARGRPEYPQAIVDWLRRELSLGPGRTVVDLGSGTGKFVAPLRATGATVIAIEPVAEMRCRALGAHPGLDARAGTAEAIPLADASVDAVVCAQSFHWFGTPRALTEIGRVLRPSAGLGLVWNVRDTTVPWVAALAAIMDPYEGETPRYASGAWRRLFPGHGFGPLAETVLANVHAGPPAEVIVDRVLSVSFIAALPASERATVRARLDALISATPELAGRSTVAVPYVTHAFATRTTD